MAALPGAIVSLALDVHDSSGMRGMTTAWRRIVREVLREVAQHWHAEILDQHFSGRNRTEYRHEPRTRWYLSVWKPRKGSGTGRYADLVLTGRSWRAAKLGRVSVRAGAAVLTMAMPAYFTTPFVGTIRGPGRPRRITRQPDKVRELTTISLRDRAALVRRARAEAIARFDAARRARGAKRAVARMNRAMALGGP
jgi:hypothetical protein